MMRQARKPAPSAPAAIEWTRANPVELAYFDPSTKICTMNCGPHRDDPRSHDERKFLCPDCSPVPDPRAIP